MRIVQTFWTAGRNPLEHSFGWPRPEYNLMAWALSCLSIREHYDEVALYTDALGKHVLIDLLHLPYTEVHVAYDETLCLCGALTFGGDNIVCIDRTSLSDKSKNSAFDAGGFCQ